MTEPYKCELCGEPMPAGEQMFKFHGYSGECPAPPLEKIAAGNDYDVTIQGGDGPDMWDKEVTVSAADFLDAARMATAQAEYHGGYVTALQLAG
jgi:hypothetical protein